MFCLSELAGGRRIPSAQRGESREDRNLRASLQCARRRKRRSIEGTRGVCGREDAYGGGGYAYGGLGARGRACGAESCRRIAFGSEPPGGDRRAAPEARGKMRDHGGKGP